MSETFFDTCVFWSCLTRCGCRATSSTLFTVLCIPRNETVQPCYFQNRIIMSSNSYTHISVRDLCISRIDLSILLQPNMWTNPGNIKKTSQTPRMNSGTVTEAEQFLFWEYINWIFGTVLHKHVKYNTCWLHLKAFIILCTGKQKNKPGENITNG
jgi:hypothetical protein